MAFPESNEVTAEESPGNSPADAAVGPGCWPGLDPLRFDDGDRIAGRDREIEKLTRLFERPKSGQSAMVWLAGDAGSGKTSLALAGLLPRLARNTGKGFEWFRITPEQPGDSQEVIERIAREILKRSAGATEETGLDFEGRIRQFLLLLEQDFSEAADYLASCFQGNPDLLANRSEGAGRIGFVCLDQLDRMGGPGNFLAHSDSGWIRANLEPLITFLHELTLTGCFPCLAVVRSLNLPAIKAAAKQAGWSSFGTAMQIASPNPESLKPFFLNAPNPSSESGSVNANEELLQSLYTSAGGSNCAGMVPFVSETLRRLSRGNPKAGEISVAHLNSGRNLPAVFAEIAEETFESLKSPNRSDAFFDLMSLLFSVQGAVFGESGGASFADITGDPVLLLLVERLIDARVLLLEGASPENARIRWSVSAPVEAWHRAHSWLETSKRFLARSRRFDRVRKEWEQERRTPVCLLHATRAIAQATELLDYHRRRPFLSDALIEFLDESINFDQHIESEGRRRSWIRIGLIGGGVLIALVLIVLIVASFL